MKTKATALLATLTLLMSTGCSTLGSPPVQTVVQELPVQHEAGVAALEAYCSVVDAADSEVQAVCDQVMPVALSSAPAVQMALSLLTSIFARRALAMRVKARQMVVCDEPGH